MTGRVAIVYDSLFPRDTGGGERVYRAIADELVSRGFEVDYFTRAGDPGETRFRVHEIWDGALYDDAAVRRTSGALAFAVAVRRELRARRSEFDAVIASALPVTTLIAARLGLGSRIPLVADWLEVWPARKWREYAGVASGTLAAILQWCGARATRMHTVNSGFTARRLAGVGARGRIIEWGLVDLAGTARATRDADDPAMLVSIGRLIADKRMDALPAAVALLRETHPSVRLTIVGAGPEAERIGDAVRLAGVADAVTLAGRLPDDDLDRVLSGATALVSASAREGFGLTIAEAASRGVPAIAVVGSDNAAAELISPGINGELASDASPEELAAAMRTVVDRGPQLRSSTADWYADAARTRGLSASLDRLLSAIAEATTSRRSH